ncbi:MAG: hypothetical protein K6B46_06810 [Opitutales bacterium]|nr:hypothetical protein [Opitutales bacterium]
MTDDNIFHPFVPGKVKPPLRDEWAAARERILFIDKGIDAAQFGAIAHTAAVVGITRIVVAESALPALLCQEAWTAAAGALGTIKIYCAENMRNALGMFSERFFILGLVREGGRRIEYGKPVVFPGKSVALYLSGDKNGVPADNISRCDYLLHIPEAAGTAFHYTPRELAAQILPWLYFKHKK